MKNKIAIILIILLAAVLYTATLRGSPGNPDALTIKEKLEGTSKPFELSPERGRFAHVLSLAENHTYALDQNLADFVFPDVGYYKGKFFSFFAPGISYMAVPFYMVGKYFNLSQVFTFGFVSLMAILNLIFIFKICREVFRLQVWSSVLACMIFGFGSTSWSYAITLYQHHFTTFFIIASFYAIFRYKNNGSWLWALFVWINSALAISVDYPNAVLLLPVMIYLLLVSFNITTDDIKKKIKVSFRTASVITMLGFLLIMGLHFYHNQYYLGSWKQISGGLVGYKGLIQKGATNLSDPNQPIIEAQHTSNVVNYFSEQDVMRGSDILSVSRDRGIFFYGPIFLLGLLGIFMILRKINLEYGILIAVVLTNFGLYSSWGDPWGGWAYGTRYLIPSMSVLAMFAAYFVASPKYSILKKLVAFVLFAYSCAVALLGALTTNAVPPAVEAGPLHVPYGYLFNIRIFNVNLSGSYIYNTYFANHFTLMQYALFLFVPIIILLLFILFILPLYESES